MTTHGQENEANYPYSATDKTCEYKDNLGLIGTVPNTDTESTYVNVSGVKCFTEDTPDDCEAGMATPSEIMAAIAVKPNAVTVNASSLAF